MRWGEMGGVKMRDILRLEFGIALQEEGGLEAGPCDLQFSDRTFSFLLHPCVVMFGQRCQ